MISCISSVQAQDLNTLTAIRKPYFILNNGADSIFVEGLKNSSTQLVFMFFAAEEDPVGLDPGLSNDGRWRSIHLLNIFKEFDLGALLSTPFRRNLLTLQPLNDFKKLGIEYYDQADLKALVDKMRHLKSKELILMVHKESVARIIEEYSGLELDDKIENTYYDRIFVIERPVSGQCKLHSFRYNIR